MSYKIKRFLFIIVCSLLFSLLLILILLPIFTSNSIIIPYSLFPYDICKKFPEAWLLIKKFYLLFLFFSNIIIFNSISLYFFNSKDIFKSNPQKNMVINSNNLYLYIGIDENNNPVTIPESGLYQNILITGTIGSGKTSSAMYPFTKQLLEYKAYDNNEKLGMLILDVKGNYYKYVKQIAKEAGRENDVLLIEVGGKVKYNPLHKPNLKPIILANRLKTILEIFSKNNPDSYWLDKSEQVLCECIKLCRIYNNGYVNFSEIHKLILYPDYYLEKINSLRSIFQSGSLTHSDIYNLYSSINFFENEFKNLDSRVLSILKSEITRITNLFISDFEISNTFCPKKEDLNFYGFKDVLEKR